MKTSREKKPRIKTIEGDKHKRLKEQDYLILMIWIARYVAQGVNAI